MEQNIASQTSSLPASKPDLGPDPKWSADERLRWYQIFSHVLMLNVSERCRQAAARQADRELGLI